MKKKPIRRVLALSYRPQLFSELVGQDDLVRAIRNQYEKQGREPLAWMFVGDTGVGKTTIARIMAVSLNCRHQKRFGEPCDTCRKRRYAFNISEVNASEVSTRDEIQELAVAANYAPVPPSRKRVIILDEAQRMSVPAQNLLLKPFEDCPPTTVWMICTTEPDKILKTLRGRCQSYTIPLLKMSDVETLVERASESVGGLNKRRLIEFISLLHEQKVRSPRHILVGLEKFLATGKAELALTQEDATVSTIRISRAALRGDWETVRQELEGATSGDARLIRAAVSGYLRAVVVNHEIGRYSSRIVESIGWLTETQFADDGIQLPVVTAALYRICQEFSRKPEKK